MRKRRRLSATLRLLCAISLGTLVFVVHVFLNAPFTGSLVSVVTFYSVWKGRE